MYRIRRLATKKSKYNANILIPPPRRKISFQILIHGILIHLNLWNSITPKHSKAHLLVPYNNCIFSLNSPYYNCLLHIPKSQNIDRHFCRSQLPQSMVLHLYNIPLCSRCNFYLIKCRNGKLMNEITYYLSKTLIALIRQQPQ